MNNFRKVGWIFNTLQFAVLPLINVISTKWYLILVIGTFVGAMTFHTIAMIKNEKSSKEGN